MLSLDIYLINSILYTEYNHFNVIKKVLKIQYIYEWGYTIIMSCYNQLRSSNTINKCNIS